MAHQPASKVDFSNVDNAASTIEPDGSADAIAAVAVIAIIVAAVSFWLHGMA